MRTNRRRFLSLLGVSTAAAPLAAKAALDESIARQTGLDLIGSRVGGMGGMGAPASMSEQAKGYAQYLPYEDRVKKSVAWMKLVGFPDFMERQIRENSKWVQGLDPDIAAKRSWSMSVKIQEQRVRNYDRQRKSYEFHSENLVKKSFIEKTLGFEWPW